MSQIPHFPLLGIETCHIIAEIMVFNLSCKPVHLSTPITANRVGCLTVFHADRLLAGPFEE